MAAIKTAWTWPVALLALAGAVAGAPTDRCVWLDSPFPKSPYDTWAKAAHDIQTAVNAAGAGETVWVTNGTYVLSAQISLSKDVTVKSVNGPAVTIVDGNDTVRGFQVTAAGAVVDGFTVQNGYNINQAGGMRLTAGMVTNCVIRDNRSGYGAGIFFASGGAARDCLITNNAATANGGGVYCQFGGSLEDCSISGNTAGHSGGGVLLGCTSLGQAWVKRCMVSGNEATEQGGGFYCDLGIIEHCTIRKNVAQGTADNTLGGGGVLVGLGCRIRNCLIVGNWANRTGSNRGGGIYLYGGGDGVESCTIVGNQAGVGGGICFAWGGTVKNSIICLNTSQQALFGPNYYYHFGGSLTYSCSHPTPTGTGNRDDHPGFVDRGLGYGLSHVEGDYRLQDSSRCRGRGTYQAWMASASDLAGEPRIYGSVVDFGAYEWQGAQADPPIAPWPYRMSLTVDSTKIDDDLFGVPVLVKLTDANFDFSLVHPRGDDIRFTDSDKDRTPLEYETERYDSAGGKAEFWVKLPVVSATEDTVFLLFCANPEAERMEDLHQVWDSNFKGVWHVGEGGTGGRCDSTVNANTAVPTKYDGNEAKDGQIDGCDHLDGGDEYMALGQPTSLYMTSAMTFSAWFRYDAPKSFGTIGYQVKEGVAWRWFMRVVNNGLGVGVSGNSVTADFSAGTVLTPGVWYHAALTYNGSQVRVYLNGDDDGSRALSGTIINASPATTYIGCWTPSDHLFDGQLDELRLSNTARSAAWIKAEYHAGKDTLLSYGPLTLLQSGTVLRLW